MKKVSISAIDDKAAEIRRDYYRQWRAANKERVKQHNQNYWKKKALEAINNQFDEKEG